MPLKISIIIATYNRAKDLEETINSISSQSLLPHELIIVDDSTDDKVKILIKKTNLPFKKQYLKSGLKDKSLPASRNIGIKNAKGDILLFIDDDVTLYPDYLKELDKVYQDKDIIAVQGYTNNLYKNQIILLILNYLRFLFFNADINPHCSKVKKGVFGNTYPIKKPKEIIEAQWFSGCNMSFKREFIKKYSLKFDEDLLRYAVSEDVDLSYRVYRLAKSKGLKIVLNPKMLLDHRVSKSGRLTRLEYVKVKYVYVSYFFFKDLNNGLLIYYWSVIGHLLHILLLSIVKRDTDEFIKNVIGFKYSLRFLKDVQKKNLKNANKVLFEY